MIALCEVQQQNNDVIVPVHAAGAGTRLQQKPTATYGKNTLLLSAILQVTAWNFSVKFHNTYCLFIRTIKNEMSTGAFDGL